MRSGDRLAFVDTGTARTVPTLLAVIADLGLGPEHVDYVIPTHVHLDHGGGSGDLMAACPGARLVVHPKGAPHLIDPSRLIAGATAVYGEEGFARDFGGLTPVPEERITLASDGLEIDLAGRTLTFLDTPGHANHHGCVFDARTARLLHRGHLRHLLPGVRHRARTLDLRPHHPGRLRPGGLAGEPGPAHGPRAQGHVPHPLRPGGRPETLVEALRRSIQDQAALALAEEGRDDPERPARLKSAVTAHLLESAKGHGVALSEAAIAGLLAVDTELNAQGLEVWLKRRERHAAAGG